MNCKPGDLAVLVRANCQTEHALGRLFEVIHLSEPSTYIAAFGIHTPQPRWWCRSVGGPVKNWEGVECGELNIPDFALRPIRDPGEDAKDNAWDWLPPVPSKERA